MFCERSVPLSLKQFCVPLLMVKGLVMSVTGQVNLFWSRFFD